MADYVYVYRIYTQDVYKRIGYTQSQTYIDVRVVSPF